MHSVRKEEAMIRTSEYELAAPAEAWRRALQPLFTDRSRWAAGRVVRAPGKELIGLLLPDLSAEPPQRTGKDFLPLSSWAAVAAPPGEPPDSPAEWLARLRPLFGQTLVIVLVGFGPDRTGWRGWVCCNDRVSPLGGLRIVGPGMLHVASEPELDELDDPARWTRLRGAVGERTFAKLRRAEVAVIGCSRTGTLAATMLAALGVRKLILFDGDSIERHNLDGAFLAVPEQAGANKAVALARRLVEYRPDLAVRAVPFALDAAHPEPAAGCLDIVATCVDSDGARLRAARWCRRHLTPHLDIGTGVTRMATGERMLAADVRLMLPGAGSGCVLCRGGLQDADQAWYEYFAPPGALPRRPPEPWNAGGRLGSLITLNSMAVSTGIQSWLDLMDGSLAGSIWHRLRWRPGAGLETNAALVTGAAGCEVCGGDR
jgi:hypothetical protein